MATTTYGTNDPLAVKLWSKMLIREVLKNTWATKFMGTTSSSIVQVKDETSKSSGDKITFALRMQMSGTGVSGDSTLEGQEEALSTYTDSLIIDQLRHASRSRGRMTQQRITYDIREECMVGLRDWWSDRIDTAFFNQLCGNTAQSDTRYTGMQAAVAQSQKYLVDGSTTGDESVSTTGVFSLTVLDNLVEDVRTATPAFRPVMVGGKPYFVAFLHPYNVTSMRTSTATGQYLDIQKSAMQGGEVADNPIFTGALGVYNGVVLHEDTRVAQGISSATGLAVSAVRRVPFCGAQALMMAYGRESGPERFTWVEELFDYQNQLGVAAGMIWGMKKAVFNSVDYAVRTASCYSVAHS